MLRMFKLSFVSHRKKTSGKKDYIAPIAQVEESDIPWK